LKTLLEVPPKRHPQSAPETPKKSFQDLSNHRQMPQSLSEQQERKDRQQHRKHAHHHPRREVCAFAANWSFQPDDDGKADRCQSQHE
jgi:hypothetical protein